MKQPFTLPTQQEIAWMIEEEKRSGLWIEEERPLRWQDWLAIGVVCAAWLWIIWRAVKEATR